MCGLIGYTGQQRPDLFKVSHILADNDARGGHSSGIYLNNKLEKTVGKSSNLLLKIGKYQNANFKTVIAHTRYATHGKQTAKNAHPYKYGKIIGAHNGVLDNYIEVSKKFNLKKPDVDSKAIFNVLNKTKDYQNLGLFGGTIAVLFTDGKDSLYVYRRNNPLYKLTTPEGIYFSSREESFTDMDGDYEEVKPNILFKYVKGKLVSETAIKHNPVVTKRIVNTDWSSYGVKTKKVSAASNYSYNNYSRNYNTWYSDYDSYGNYHEVEVEQDITNVDRLDVLGDIAWDFRAQLTQFQKSVIEDMETHFESIIEQEYENEDNNLLPF